MRLDQLRRTAIGEDLCAENVALNRKVHRTAGAGAGIAVAARVFRQSLVADVRRLAGARSRALASGVARGAERRWRLTAAGASARQPFRLVIDAAAIKRHEQRRKNNRRITMYSSVVDFKIHHRGNARRLVVRIHVLRLARQESRTDRSGIGSVARIRVVGYPGQRAAIRRRRG